MGFTYYNDHNMFFICKVDGRGSRAQEVGSKILGTPGKLFNIYAFIYNLK